MKLLLLLISIYIFIQACDEKPKDVAKLNSNGYNIEDDYKLKLINTFSEVIKVYPKDSLSLYRVYFLYNSTSSDFIIQKQIKQLEGLISKNTIKKYYEVEETLIPLMSRIVNSNAIEVSQIDSIVDLYSYFDHYLGKGLFSQLIGEKDNYELIWKTFEIIANNDTNHLISLSALIELDNNINTNVELSESIPAFVVKGIYKNPYSLLDIYLANQVDIDYLEYVSDYFKPNQDLISILKEISKNSSNEKHREAALEIIQLLNEK
jgi:hypothetical protein